MRLGWCLRLLPLAALAAVTAAVCPSRCRCDDTALETNCTGARLNSFPIALNPRLKRLLLADNAIRRLDASMVSSYNFLEYLDLSSNNMVSVQAGSFADQKNLLELRLSQNQLLELEPQVFLGLKQLSVLDLSHNRLRELPEGLLQPTPLLQQLNLAGNLLPTLTAGALLGAVSLRRLNVADNELRQVPAAALAQLAELDSLSLAGNSITRLSADELALAGPRLTDLSLAGNQLTALAGGTFRRLTSLRRLNLASTALATADAETFAGLHRLEELHLGGNPLSRLGAAALSTLPRLRLVAARACPGLNTIEAGAFAHNPALDTVLLEENPSLAALPRELCLRLPLLRRLSLHANALTSLPADAADWTRVHADLSGNPWRCDCKLRWLAQLPAAANASGAICAAPAALRGRLVRDVAPDELDCGGAEASSLALIVGLSVAAALLLLLAVLLCYRYRHRLHKMFKVLPWRDRVGLKRKEPYHHGTTYYCHDMYDPIHPRDSKPIPVTEL
ncbi:platelet glycoprotein V-like [Pollicipes pollicipes]|uniref:platelet glycoprotein V-like n=1 Tax=Pollicipes pollicipes TaxID=41117 RepID=UPI0018852378|nr:platelet glycoprotein V-like [Pollicipes pollicipes]XP_037075167.1 platelet glycoprotein V-like [Pollicipes pollicipes]XP_037075168.1 platelet glycoprotein V-like [Pollicipes pollicipes]